MMLYQTLFCEELLKEVEPELPPSAKAHPSYPSKLFAPIKFPYNIEMWWLEQVILSKVTSILPVVPKSAAFINFAPLPKSFPSATGGGP